MLLHTNHELFVTEMRTRIEFYVDEAAYSRMLY
jgi:hypothetical protein